MKRKRKHFKFSDNYNLYFAKKKKEKKNIEYVIFFFLREGDNILLYFLRVLSLGQRYLKV